MTDLTLITSFFGWCTVINLGIYAVTALLLLVFRTTIRNIHSKLLNVAEGELDAYYARYLANYKIFIVILNFTPYLALKILIG